MNAILGVIFRFIALAALYGFLVLSAWMLWRSFSCREPNAGKVIVPAISLSTSQGDEPQTLHFTSTEISLGRDPDCDFVLTNPTVSGRHARLSYNLNQWWLEDLKSTNGSYLDSLRVEEAIVLKDGDDISCGDVLIRVSIKPKE